MKISVSKKDLTAGVAKCAAIAATENVRAHLKNLLCRTTKDGLTLAATDLDLFISVTLPSDIVDVMEEGDVTIPAKKFLEALREITGEVVVLETKKSGSQVKVTSGKSSVSINCGGIPPEDFPMPEGEIEFHSIKASTLADLINATAYAMSNDSMRKNLCGIYLEAFPSQPIRMVATDGHRLVYANADLTDETSFTLKKGIIIPAKGINEIKRIVKDVKSNGGGTEGKTVLIGMQTEGNMLVLKDGNTTVKVVLFDGPFPEYQKVIPLQIKESAAVVVKRDDLFCSLRRMKVITDERFESVLLTASPGESYLRLESRNADSGIQARDEIEIVEIQEEMEIAFNVKYLLDPLTSMEARGEEENIGMWLAGAQKLLVLKPQNGLSLIMPLKQ